jgi:SAM-dependent methyltransferase
MEPEWSAFCKITNGRPPREILLKALEAAGHKGKALDIGAGALNETRYLLSQGFEVTAVDSEPASAESAARIQDEKLQFEAVSYEVFRFPKDHYDLAVALYALPFTPPEHFKRVVQKLLGSIKPGGVFVGQFFGPDDEWNDGSSHINFVSKNDVKNMFKSFEILSLEEEKGPGTTATGGTKYWHIFHIVAKKR